MSRSTQFIGLTKDAQDFVSKLKKHASPNITHGMFGEEIELGVWEDEFCIYIEEVVDVPWSSGPMIFTALKVQYINKSLARDQDEENNIYFRWVINPTLVQEVDEVRGHYYV